MKDVEKSKLICLTGLDGSGKSTQFELLKRWMDEQKYVFDFYSTLRVEKKDPINYRKYIDFIKKKKINSNEIMTCIYNAFQVDEFLKNKLIPSLEKGRIVITDRYIESFECRFNMLNLPISWIDEIFSSFPKPMISIFIDTTPENCIHRIDARDVVRGLGENYDELVEAREFYFRNINKYGLKVINGNVSVNEVFFEIINIIENHIL